MEGKRARLESRGLKPMREIEGQEENRHQRRKRLPAMEIGERRGRKEEGEEP
ncbi:hypothetical protein SLEP1_g57367 [Rubroshorea leprosula]|uniref:Uncharacterized protein n=1 Tax=Rubroshorea leprosula TaxID=152421 RepID=A0AAV5MNH8_9ROSI|nr:hypothetical protein SLEP1_g57367 [Rubroshorea leprosula]